ncbi:hypothetical protein SAMN05444266_104178 [Chitinophaga jiangningensis]|uniref:Uncharacterized protein n=1 Tax=Chitinophaga jiangningensis TaxID=1419482 RepID=A0A1M7C3F7_9BACT|nr:hypothetical protein SAMN05444266_104178 [Chitinophaga jiangningensis]
MVNRYAGAIDLFKNKLIMVQIATLYRYKFGLKKGKSILLGNPKRPFIHCPKKFNLETVPLPTSTVDHSYGNPKYVGIPT